MLLSMNNTSRKVDSVSGKSTTQANGETLKECSDLEQRSAVGKRFARRAKRWAELQQRRQNSRNAHAALYSRAFAPLSVQSDSFLAASTQAFVRKPTRVTSNRGTSCGQYACCAYEQARYVHSCFVNSSARTPQLIEHVSNAQLINVKLATMGVGMAPFSESSTEFRYPQGRMCGERLSGSFFDDPTDAMIMSRAPTAGKPGSPDMLRSSQKHRYYQPDAGEPEDHVRFGQYFIMNAGSKQEAFVSVYQLPAELHVYPNTAASTKHTAVVHLDTSSSSSSSISSSYSSKASSSRARDEYSSSSSDEDLISWIASDLANVSIQCGDGTSCPFDIGDVKSRLDELRQPPPLPDSSLACCANDVIEATESKEVNTLAPPDRQWVMMRHADPERPIATFTVLCYNVLCDKYASSNLYSYCPSWALNWEYRKAAILKEIRHYEADIITLQEVETEQFRSLFLPELEAIGYAGIFSPKSRAKTMSEEDRKYVDGCAIFWKYDKFEMDREHLIEFTQVAIKKAQTSEHMLNRVMPRDNIALCAVLRIKENVYSSRRMAMSPNENVVGNPLVVCTAHIHWDPEFCDVKLVQCMMLVQEIGNLLEEIAEKYRITPQQTPVLICGDLNSLPESGVFEFLSKGAIAKDHPDLKGFRDDPCLSRLSVTDDPKVYTHGLRLDSAVDVNALPFTNYTLEFKGVIDYIFSTPQSLARLGVLGPLDMTWVQANKIIGFPHPHVPSDHVPIMAQYAIIPTSHQRPQPSVHHYGSSHSSSYGAVGR